MFAAILRASSRVSRRCGPPPRLRLEVDIGECLPVAVTDDVAASVVLFDVPGRREAAGFGHHRHLGRPAQLLQGREVEQLGLFGPPRLLLDADLRYAFNMILK